MHVHQDFSTLPLFHKAIVTIGTFDGVHLGHRQIVHQMREEARRVGGETVIITFHPHPRKVVRDDKGEVRLLTTMPERIQLLEGLGVDHLVVIPFTEAFASMDAAEYIRDFLVRKFHPHTIIIGYDHRFGRGRTGDYHLLEALAPTYGYQVREIDAQLLKEVSISSTRIREALIRGDVQEAAAQLGYPYFFEGQVVQGDQRGRSIGFPTANINIADTEKLLPAQGVYAVRVRVMDGAFSGAQLNGMMNIGTRPTVDGQTVRTEIHLFDFSGDLYGSSMRVEMIGHIRNEQKFSGLDALKAQLSADRDQALGMLGNP
jgi:riboflavin kinase / FMN adenylyltransferase